MNMYAKQHSGGDAVVPTLNTSTVYSNGFHAPAGPNQPGGPQALFSGPSAFSAPGKFPHFEQPGEFHKPSHIRNLYPLPEADCRSFRARDVALSRQHRSNFLAAAPETLCRCCTRCALLVFVLKHYVQQAPDHLSPRQAR